VRLAEKYRGLLVFGPLQESPDLATMTGFLHTIAQHLATDALSWLQTLYLRAQQSQAERSTNLIVHRYQTTLQPVTSKFGVIKHLSSIESSIWKAASEGEEILLKLSDVIVRALTASMAGIEHDDLDIQEYSLSAFVGNCVESFQDQAISMQRELIADPSIDRLPYAEVDIGILFIALSNLIDNALKYSFPNTDIVVSSKYDTKHATITVQNDGEQLSESARHNLVEPGKRHGMSARARRIPGTGIGIWEASLIATAHGGHLDFSSVEIKRHQRTFHKVKVWLKIPFKQSPSPKRRKS
jgi:signal transduction histidine kinase